MAIEPGVVAGSLALVGVFVTAIVQWRRDRGLNRFELLDRYKAEIERIDDDLRDCRADNAELRRRIEVLEEVIGQWRLGKTP